ncbi:MAG: hypothetical protein JWM09_581 [Francisellaceae bacterium]|nr:hypothetical protein [Francisellaceae bacterium]
MDIDTCNETILNPLKKKQPNEDYASPSFSSLDKQAEIIPPIDEIKIETLRKKIEENTLDILNKNAEERLASSKRIAAKMLELEALLSNPKNKS